MAHVVAVLRAQTDSESPSPSRNVRNKDGIVKYRILKVDVF
jgi:hypothetical protein